MLWLIKTMSHTSWSLDSVLILHATSYNIPSASGVGSIPRFAIICSSQPHPNPRDTPSGIKRVQADMHNCAQLWTSSAGWVMSSKLTLQGYLPPPSLTERTPQWREKQFYLDILRLPQRNVTVRGRANPGPRPPPTSFPSHLQLHLTPQPEWAKLHPHPYPATPLLQPFIPASLLWLFVLFCLVTKLCLTLLWPHGL